MKIISFDEEPSSQRGGQELALVEVLTGLSALGHEVELGYIKKGNLLGQYERAGIRTIQIKRVNIYNKLSIIEFREFYSSSRSFSSPGSSVIYINQLKDAPLAVFMKLIYDAKVICHLRLPPLGQSAQIKMALPFIDGFIVANQHMFNLHSANSIPKEKLHIIPDGFWMNKLPEPLRFSSPQFKIAYVGRIDAIKGIHVLIDAAKILNERNVSFKIDIAGIPTNQSQINYLQELKDRTEKYNLKAFVNFIGHISDPITHLAQYDVCVFPSIWEEPFGRVILESLLAATPLIGHDVGSVSEIMNDSNKKWVYKTTTELADKLVVLKENPGSYRVNERKAFVKENFDLGKIIYKIEDLLMSHNRKKSLTVDFVKTS